MTVRPDPGSAPDPGAVPDPGAARACAEPLWLRHPLWSAGAGALVIAFSALLVERSGASPSTAAVFRCVYALPLLAALAARERRRFGARPRAERRAAWFAGLFFAADLILWHHTINAVGTGLATVLANTQVVVVGIAAWVVLGERPERRVIIAVPVMLGGVVLISGVVGSGAFGQRPLLGGALGLLTAVAYAGFLLLLRRSLSDLRRPAGPLLDASAVAALAAVLAGWAYGDLDLAPAWPGHGWLVVLALSSQVLAWLLISVSLPRLPAVVTSIVLLLQPVGAVAIGVALLAETPSVVQYAGVVLVLAGVVAATLGRERRPGGAPPPAPGDVASVTLDR
ncbi:MAG: DMT family transporter [Euzebyales bacterium]|jgi:drug/metabolite transporter (DMT)-like permease|nr:DMT family transporter [Euzebyales bacterium]